MTEEARFGPVAVAQRSCLNVRYAANSDGGPSEEF
jgi:hypothetical protein